jgi:hypothetical protein
MFREGPLPVFLHGLVEYVAGALFIALPLLLDYESGAATAVSIVLGVILICVAASTDWSLSLNNQIPKPAHFALDWVIAGVLLASPFLFGFSGETAPTVVFLLAGVLHILMTIGTRFGPKVDRDAERRARAKSTSSKVRSAAAPEGQGQVERPKTSTAQSEPPPPRQSEPAPPPPPEPPSTGDRKSARRN